MEELNNLQAKLISVRETDFSMFPELLDRDNKTVEYNINFQILPKVDENIAAVSFRVVMCQGATNLLSISVEYTFRVNGLSVFVKDGGKSIAGTLSSELVSVAIGTTRGMLIVKTSGTSLSQFILPVVNIRVKGVTEHQ